MRSCAPELVCGIWEPLKIQSSPKCKARKKFRRSAYVRYVSKKFFTQRSSWDEMWIFKGSHVDYWAAARIFLALAAASLVGYLAMSCLRVLCAVMGRFNPCWQPAIPYNTSAVLDVSGKSLSNP